MSDDANRDTNQLHSVLDSLPDDLQSLTRSLANIRERIAQLSSAAVTLK